MTSSLRYGGGLPRVDTRVLADAEAERVGRELRRARAWLSGAVVVLTTSALLATSGLLPLHPAVAFTAALVVVASVIAVALGSMAVRAAVAAAIVAQGVVLWMASVMPEARPPHPLLVGALQAGTVALSARLVLLRLHGAWSLYRRRVALAEDLHARDVDRCAGRVRELAEARTFQILQRRGEIVEAGPRHEIELLPRSGFVLQVDGRPLRRPLLARVTSVAPTVPHALRVALPSDLYAIASPTVQLERRSLTPAERQELERRAAGMRRPPWSLYVASPAVLAAAAWQWQHASAEVPWLGIAAIAAYLLGGATAFHYVQRLRTASRLRSDAELRWLVTVTDRNAPEGAAPHLEMLPVSRLAWTERARPASWRLDT